jgi:dihydroorotase
MTDALILAEGRLIDPRHGIDGVRHLWLENGKVKEVSERPLAIPGVQVLNLKGKWVLPGFIDLHVHLREPGEEGKETILTGTRAAVAGGFTAVVAMPNTRPTNDNAIITELILTRAREAGLARVYPAGAITKGLAGEELSEMGALRDAGCVCVTDDGRPVMSAGLMRRALQYARGLGLPVMVHEEDLNLSAHGAMTEGARGTRMGLLPIPASAESAMVARDLELLEETGGRLHIAHLSCAASVRLVREAKRRGLPVTAEVTPHHFTLTDAAVEGYDTHAKMNPPLRRDIDLQAVQEALSDGTVDAIATDHAPHGISDKQVEFAKAANGVVGLETALTLTLERVRAGQLTVAQMANLLSSGPAAAFQLPGGHLGVGAPADVTVVDSEVTWTVDPERFFSRSRNTPFRGRAVQGRVLHTLVGGRLVFSEGAVKEPR